MSTSPKVVNIGKSFSRFPAGRYLADGPASGQRFREEVLVPLLAAGHSILVQLDDALGYGSSFLEEAFGGLVRQGHDAEEILKKITFESFDDSLIEEIQTYIREAESNG